MSLENEIKSLQNGSFEELMPLMTLSNKHSREIFQGPGLIRQVNNSFQYIIFAVNVTGGIENTLKDRFIDKYKLGELIKEVDFFKLTSSSGWEAENLWSIDKNYTENGTIVRGYTHEIIKTVNEADTIRQLNKLNNKKGPIKSAYDKPGLQYIFFENLDFPANKTVINESKHISDEKYYPGWSLDALKFNTSKYEIRLFRRKEYTDYRITSLRKRAKHNDKIEQRALGTLQFVLGRPVFWNIKINYFNNTKRMHFRLFNSNINFKRNAKPPIKFTGSVLSQDFINLYKKYSYHALKNTKDDIHSIYLRLNHVLHSFARSYETQFLELSTQIEGLIKEYYQSDFTVPDCSDLKIVINDTKNYLKSQKVDGEFFEKISNHLGRLTSKTASPKRILLTLAEKNKVNKRDVECWDMIRHPKAHGDFIGMDQDKMLAIGKLTVLMYHLIFNIIGYSGKYTDYGELGYKYKEYQ